MTGTFQKTHQLFSGNIHRKFIFGLWEIIPLLFVPWIPNPNRDYLTENQNQKSDSQEIPTLSPAWRCPGFSGVWPSFPLNKMLGSSPARAVVGLLKVWHSTPARKIWATSMISLQVSHFLTNKYYFLKSLNCMNKHHFINHQILSSNKNRHKKETEF